MRPMQAIAAMAENRVIGNGPDIPWHIPEDFRWFKEQTMGHVLVMGRKTFESLGGALPGRETWVLSRSGFKAKDCRVFADFASLPPITDGRLLWLCGGAQLYAQLLPCCSDLYLSRIYGNFDGDALFPPFEDQFALSGLIRETPQFRIEHYRNKTIAKI